MHYIYCIFTLPLTEIQGAFVKNSVSEIQAVHCSATRRVFLPFRLEEDSQAAFPGAGIVQST